MAKFVTIQKTGITDDPLIASATWDEFKPGGPNTKSLPEGYTMTGILHNEPQVGQPLMLLRQTRNGVPALGIFTSSVITKIEGNKIWTLNSIYTILEEKPVRFEAPPQEAVNKYPAEKEEVLRLVDQPEAFITDESSFGDFALSDEE